MAISDFGILIFFFKQELMLYKIWLQNFEKGYYEKKYVLFDINDQQKSENVSETYPSGARDAKENNSPYWSEFNSYLYKLVYKNIEFEYYNKTN